MLKTVRTLLILVALPPLALFGLHGFAMFLSPADTDFALFGVAVAAILAIAAAITTSGWRWSVQLLVSFAYTFAVFLGLPMLALLAACATGDCL